MSTQDPAAAAPRRSSPVRMSSAFRTRYGFGIPRRPLRAAKVALARLPDGLIALGVDAALLERLQVVEARLPG